MRFFFIDQATKNLFYCKQVKDVETFLRSATSDGVASVGSTRRALWFADAHRDGGKRFVVRADEILTSFLELETGDSALQ